MTSKEASLSACIENLHAVNDSSTGLNKVYRPTVLSAEKTMTLVYSSSLQKGNGWKHAISAEEMLQDHTDSQKRIIMNDTFFTQSVLTLTTGVFITGFALKLHAPAFVIGLLVAIPCLAQLLQLPSVALVARCASLKNLIIRSMFLGRLALLSFAVIPFCRNSHAALAALVIFYALYACLSAVSTCAWNAWVRDTINPDELGQFFSKKLALSSLITLLLTFTGGIFIDWGASYLSKIHTPVYSLLFLFTALLGIVGVFPLRKIRENAALHVVKRSNSSELLHDLSNSGIDASSVMTESSISESSISDSSKGGFLASVRHLFKPFNESNYRNLIKFLTIYDFSINLAIPFLTVYMLNTLHYSMGLVSAITIASQLANYFFLPTWGKIADRFSNRSVLMICGPIQLFCLFAWCVFVLPGVTETTLPFVIAIHVILGIGTAGVSLANGNIAMKLSPADRTAPHMACTNMMASLASGASPLLTGWASQNFAHINIGIPGFENSCWYFIFSFACLLGCIGLVQLTKVEESGTVRTRQLLRDLLIDPFQKHIRHSIS